MGFWGDEEMRTKIASVGRSRARGVQKKSSYPLILLMKGGGRYQGDGAADTAMVAHSPNRLLGYGGVGGLRIPP